MPTKLPVKPTAFGTVMLKKKVARLLDAASAAIRSVRTFSMMWMPLSVIRILFEQVAPPRVDDDDVALTQRGVVHLEPGLEICRGDLRALIQARLLARG